MMVKKKIMAQMHNNSQIYFMFHAPQTNSALFSHYILSFKFHRNSCLEQMMTNTHGPISTLLNNVKVTMNGIMRYQDYSGSDLWMKYNIHQNVVHVTDDFIQITEWFDLLNLASLKNKEIPLYNAELIELDFGLSRILKELEVSFYSLPQILLTYEGVEQNSIPDHIEYPVTNSIIFTTYKASCTEDIVLIKNSPLQQIMMWFQQNEEYVQVDLSQITLILGLDEYNLANSPFQIFTYNAFIVINLDIGYTKGKRCLQVKTDYVYDTMSVALEQRQILTLSNQGKNELKCDADCIIHNQSSS